MKNSQDDIITSYYKPTYSLKPLFFGGQKLLAEQDKSEKIMKDPLILQKLQVDSSIFIKQGQDKNEVNHQIFLTNIKKDRIRLRSAREVSSPRDKKNEKKSGSSSQDVPCALSAQKMEQILLKEKPQKVFSQRYESPALKLKNEMKVPDNFSKVYQVVNQIKRVSNLARVSTIQALKVLFDSEFDKMKIQNYYKMLMDHLGEQEKLIFEAQNQVKRDTILYQTVKFLLPYLPSQAYSQEKDRPFSPIFTTKNKSHNEKASPFRNNSHKDLRKTKQICQITPEKNSLERYENQPSFRSCCSPEAKKQKERGFQNGSPFDMKLKIVNQLIKEKMYKEIGKTNKNSQKSKEFFNLQGIYLPLSPSKFNMISKIKQNLTTTRKNSEEEIPLKFSQIDQNAIDCISKQFLNLTIQLISFIRVWKEKFGQPSAKEEAIHLAFNAISPQFISEKFKEKFTPRAIVKSYASLSQIGSYDNIHSHQYDK